MNVIVTGSISYDEIMDFPGKFVNYLHPEKLHQINVSFVVNKLEKQLGGTAVNIAYNIALNKVNNVFILASIGKDGGLFMEFLKKNSIDTSGINIDRNFYTGTGKVITDKSDNQIWGFYYGANESTKKIELKKYKNKDTLLIISANHPNPFLKFQNQAIKLHIPYIYDPGMALTWIKDKDLKQGVLNSDYLIGNDYEMAMILKRLRKTINELTSDGLKIITTLGEDGVKYEEFDKVSKVHKVYQVKSYKVHKVVDPTGAGDAWRGGFLAGLSKRLKLKDCLKLGNVMASFAIEKYGTVNHKPTKKQIIDRLKKL